MKNIKESFKLRLIALVVIPLVIVGIALTVMSAVKVKNIVKEDAQSELLASAKGIRSILESMSSEDFVVNIGDEVEVLDSDGYDLSYLNESFDKYFNESELYVTFIWGDTRILTSVKNDGKRAVNTKINSEIAKRVLSGEDVIAENVSVAGNNCVVCYVPFKNPGSGKTVGSVFVGMKQDALDKTVSSAVAAVVIIALLLAVVSIAVAFVMASKMAKPIVAVGSLCNSLADGDLTVEDVSDGADRTDDIGNMIRSANKLKGYLRGIIGNITDGISRLNESSGLIEKATERAENSMGDLANATEEVANGATNQAQEVTSAATSVSTITMNVDSINGNVEATNKCTDEMNESSKEVNTSFDELILNIEKSMEALNSIADKMGKVADAVDNVMKAANDITGIASQTNLLSLNASIEAARAGDAGRGFAVVASEISALAKQSNDTSTKIQAIMKELNDETIDAVNLTNELKEVMNVSHDSSKESQKSIGTLVKNIEETISNVEMVSEGTEQVNTLCRSLDDAIQNLSAISEENAASSQETSASIQQVNGDVREIKDMSVELKELAVKLDELVKVFKI